MTEEVNQVVPPTVSVILPTYNRVRFLRQALDSIGAQTFRDWELIVVDDGSTDGTRDQFADLARTLAAPVRYVFQENQGAYGARNTGLDLARGQYIAFFDSDDQWLPNHLADCMTALQAHPDVDWVYGSCRAVQLETGQIVSPNVFYMNGQPRPFLRLRHQRAGSLHIVDDPGAPECAVLHGLYAGLQNSVIRRSLFEGFRFQTAYRNEAEDQLLVVRALAERRRLAYFDQVHVIYNAHDQNSSAAGSDHDLDKRLRVFAGLIRGYEDLARQGPADAGLQRAITRRLAREHFWTVGYALLWQNGRGREALANFRQGLRHWPWDWRCWRTYLLACVRVGLGWRESRPCGAK